LARWVSLPDKTTRLKLRQSLVEEKRRSIGVTCEVLIPGVGNSRGNASVAPVVSPLVVSRHQLSVASKSKRPCGHSFGALGGSQGLLLSIHAPETPMRVVR